MVDQAQFDKFVQDYNKNFLFLLKRASGSNYQCLISAFLVLNDLLWMISTLYEAGNFTYKVPPHPINFRGNDALLRALGFSAEDIESIYGFLGYVRQTHGKEFEECIEAGKQLCFPSVRLT